MITINNNKKNASTYLSSAMFAAYLEQSPIAHSRSSTLFIAYLEQSPLAHSRSSTLFIAYLEQSLTRPQPFKYTIHRVS
jgi:hypothetical protein